MILMLTLKTNHTLMGDVSLSGDYIIKKPVQVVQQPTEQGPVMGFAPFLDFSEEFITGIPIKATDVLCETTPVKDLINEYNKIFGSGIEIVSKLPPRLVK